MDTFEIRDDEINVEEIMRRIRENIKKRKESGAYTKETEALINEPLQPPAEVTYTGQDDLQQNLDYINSNWDIHAEYSINSHRPILGRFLIRGRRLVHGEVRRYVDSIAGKQSEFNARVVRTLNSCIKGFDKKINDTAAAVNKDIDSKVSEAVYTINKDIDSKVSEAVSTVNKDIESRINEAVSTVNKDIESRINEAISTVNKDIESRINEAISTVNKDIESRINEAVYTVNKDIESRINEAVSTVNKDIESRINEAISTVNKDIESRINEAVYTVNKDIDSKLSEVVSTINKDIDSKVNEAVAAVDKDIENKAWLANLLEKRLQLHQHSSRSIADEQNTVNINYFVFNEIIGKAWNKLSGNSVQGVPNVFEDALNIFGEGKNILEIGCGNGTFLQMLKERGIQGYGIDLNEDFILYCKKKGLNIEQADALTHLKSLQDKMLDGVFAVHVIEHMQFYELKQLLELCYAKMQFGSHIILVTPNILNVTVSSNIFYMDPTHLNHIHPDVLKFLLESCGFRDIQERFYQPVPDEIKLKKIEYNPDMKEKKIYETMNYNISILNNLFFGYRDFAVIAKK